MAKKDASMTIERGYAQSEPAAAMLTADGTMARYHEIPMRGPEWPMPRPPANLPRLRAWHRRVIDAVLLAP